MLRNFFLLPLKWLLTLGLVAGLLAGAVAVNYFVRRALADESEKDAVEQPDRVKDGKIELGAKLARDRGLQDERARPTRWYPRVLVYGRVVPNPQATTELRSPFAGTLRAAPSTPWPVPGKPVQAGQLIGRVDIRIGPLERLDLQVKLKQACNDLRGAEEVLQVRQQQVNRLQKVATPEIVSRRELDEALVELAKARTQKENAKAALDLWQQAQDAIDGRDQHPGSSAWSVPLKATAAGEVTELAGQPGMAVEAGALVARVIDFRRALVRMDVPQEALAAGPPQEIDLLAVSGPGSDDPRERPAGVRATLVGAAPQVDAISQLAGYWYEVAAGKGEDRSGASWRLGLFVRARVEVRSGKPRKAVSVPEQALIYRQGKTWVYVRTEPGKYRHREVEVLGRDNDRWVLGSGVTAGDPVVYRQAQLLDSEEHKGAVDTD
jgi:RND family efflux transporter MFP subunit